jgi:hypothetical protein
MLSVRPVAAPRGRVPGAGHERMAMPDTDALAERRLERSVAATLRIIAAVHVERQAPPIRAARQRLGAVYGATRLAKTLERETLERARRRA